MQEFKNPYTQCKEKQNRFTKKVALRKVYTLAAYLEKSLHTRRVHTHTLALSFQRKNKGRLPASGDMRRVNMKNNLLHCRKSLHMRREYLI
jgi:hypothetical protein